MFLISLFARDMKNKIVQHVVLMKRMESVNFYCVLGTMQARGVWVWEKEAKTSTRQLRLDRRFPTVERRAHRQDKGVAKVPADDQFLLDSRRFLLPQGNAPLAWAPLPDGSRLGPFLYIERQEVGLLLLPLLPERLPREWSESDDSSSTRGGVADLTQALWAQPSYAAVLGAGVDWLEDLAGLIAHARQRRGESFSWAEIDTLLGTMMPFGTVLDSEPQRVWDMQKNGFPPRMPALPPQRPAWKPWGGSAKLPQVHVHVQHMMAAHLTGEHWLGENAPSSSAPGEEALHDQDVAQGIVTVEAQLPGTSELLLTLRKGSAHALSREGLSPRVTVFELERDQKRFKMRPPAEAFVPYSYSIAVPTLPVVGAYQMKSLSTTRVRFLLQIRTHMRLQSLSVRVPFPHRSGGISSIEATPTLGKCSVSEDGMALLWVIAPKLLASKSGGPLNMALPGFLNFYSAPRIEVEAPSSGDDQSHWLVGENSYAEISFESEGQDWAEWGLDVQVSPAPLAPLTPTVKKTIRNAPGAYRLWNTLGQHLMLPTPP